MKRVSRMLVLGIVLISVLFFNKSTLAAYQLDKGKLIQELAGANYAVLGEADYYGIPCVRIVLPVGQAIYQVCRQVPLLNANFFEAREAIAVLNGLHYAYPRGYEGEPNQTEKETILIPLDTTIQSKVFPEFSPDFAQHSQFIFIDRERQFLTYYEDGHLITCFPVSTGRTKKGTPAMEGWVKCKKEEHTSTIYDVLMPFSLLLARPYFLHAGVMPGAPDSAGCIRLFTEHAKWLFERVGNRKTRFKVV